MKNFFKILAVLVLAVSIPFVCTAENTAAPVRVAGLKGPTGMALAHMITVDEGKNYELNLVAAPAEVNALVISGQVDIAAVPINAGSVLFNKTEGGVRALSLITRGMLYVLENGTEKNRLGISVSKKVGNSVVRHRVTRLVREGYRLQEQQFLRGWDIVVIARTPAAQCTQEEAKENLRYLGKKLHIREAV